MSLWHESKSKNIVQRFTMMVNLINKGAAFVLTFPTQFEIQGQWWSYCSMQCLHVGQCFERSGLIICLTKRDTRNISRSLTIKSKIEKVLLVIRQNWSWKLMARLLEYTLHVGQSWDQFPVQTEELFTSRFNKGSWTLPKKKQESVTNQYHK